MLKAYNFTDIDKRRDYLELWHVLDIIL